MSREKTQQIRRLDIILVLVLRFIVGISFVAYITIVQGWDMIPIMIDQLRYLADIDTLDHNIGFLISHDDVYEANRTLYSRVLGFIAWLIPLRQEPIFIAVMGNTIFHVIIGYYTAKLFTSLGGRRERLLFWLMSFSPVLTAYSFFALRDIMIVMLSVMALYFLVKRRYLFLLVLSISMFFLRPFQIATFLVWLYMEISYKFIRKQKYKKMYSALSLCFMVLFTFLVGKYFSPDSVTTYASSGVDWVRLFLGSTGLEAFFTEGAGVRVSQSQNTIARVIMIDSIIMPLLTFLVFLFLMVKFATGRLKNYSEIFYLSALAVLSMFFITYTYLAIQDAFAFRKLLSLIPLMWVILFLVYEKYKHNKISSK